MDVTKCVVNTDPNFHSHWLVSALCAFGNYLKATVLYLLREKWLSEEHAGVFKSAVAVTVAAAAAAATEDYVYIHLNWACFDEQPTLLNKKKNRISGLSSASFCSRSDLFIIVNILFDVNVQNYPQILSFSFLFCAYVWCSNEI